MRKIGQYQLVTEIARGGMGEIYIAQDTRLNREVAVKLLMATLANDPKFAQRFIREGKLVAPLEHPNIVPLYDYGVDLEFNQPYLVMRLMRGGTLEDRLDEMSEEEIWRTIRQIGVALDYAHKNNVIHRDLKPSNILYDREGNAYLTDFGIALQAQSTETRLTQGGIIGTPHYMSPEQFRSGMALDGKSDQYSFAVMIYELLAKHPLFEGDTMALLFQHLNEEPDTDILRKKGFPEHVIAALLKALSKEPGDRFESVGDFVKALQGQIAVPKKISRAATALEMEPTELLEIEPTELIEAQPNAELQPTSRTKAWIYSIVGIIAVAGLALIAFNWIQSREPLPESEVIIDESPPTVVQNLESDTENTPDSIVSVDEVATEEAPTEKASIIEEDNQFEGIDIVPLGIFQELQIDEGQLRLSSETSGSFVLTSENNSPTTIYNVYGASGSLNQAGVLGIKYNDDVEAYAFEVHCFEGTCGIFGENSDESTELEEGMAAEVNVRGTVSLIKTGSDYDQFSLLSEKIPMPVPIVLAEPSPTLQATSTVTNSQTVDQTPEASGILEESDETSEEEATPTPMPAPTNTLVAVPECDFQVTATEIYTYDDPANNFLAPVGLSLRITFELLNSGTCEWDSSFALSHISGSDFGSEGGTSLDQSVAPGESITVVVRDLSTPNSTGQYPSVWGLLTDEGVLIENNFEVELGVYARETATPVPTVTVEQAVSTPTTEAGETVEGESVNFNHSVGNCTYPGDGIEYRCDLVITPYGGVSGDTYTVWVNDSEPMARYYPITTTFTHFINARRCATYIHEVIVQSDTTGERFSRNIFFDPNSNSVFPGGTTCSE